MSHAADPGPYAPTPHNVDPDRRANAHIEAEERGVLAGIRALGAGFRIIIRSPRLLVIGMLPALITGILYTAALITLLFKLDELMGVLPIPEDWPSALETIVRVLAAGAIGSAAVFLAIITFTTVTLLIGGPFYEHIAEKVEDSFGEVPEAEISGIRLFLRGLRDSALLLFLSVLCAILLFCVGLIPVIGQSVILVVTIGVGAWLLCLELVGIPFARRGLKLEDRHRALRRHWPRALGFAVPVYLLCTFPGGAIIVMPAAVAGGTILARNVLATYATQ